MAIFKFTIWGNPENSDGNPCGYTRTTQAGTWVPKYQRYVRWKAHVANAFVNSNPEGRSGFLRTWALSGKPINLKGEKAYLRTMIYYSSGTRSDPDNVQKGIADALFVDDKNVAGSYDFAWAPDGKGRVDVEVDVPGWE